MTDRIERFGKVQSEHTDIDIRRQHCQHCVGESDQRSGCRAKYYANAGVYVDCFDEFGEK